MTPAQRRKHFQWYLSMLGMRPTELARYLQSLGDFRTETAILRSLQRISAGTVGIPAELFVIIRMLALQKRLAAKAKADHDQA